ncbi:glycosyltransferase family A protein [Sphingomonas sp.]|jgi:GT2 family glycosyltransferase|uniref:glycosyltransferase n=1 Tax=Sphingomonas sp. TaxID=28214 RepID=UPI002EDB8F7A
MTTPRVSVIVPVWNRPDDLRRCLASLAEQTLPRGAYEVIVVDNGSSDSTPDVARAAAVILLEEPQPGSYAARNRGIAAARGEWLAFIDSDCRADRDWLRAALEAGRANPHAGVIAGRVELEADGAGLCDAYERLFAFNQEKLAKQGRAVTANWLSPAALIRELGGFRADLKSGGDVDLAKRMAAAGYPVAYAPQMLVFHPARATLADLTGKARRVVGGQMVSQGRTRNPLYWTNRLARVTAYRTRDVWRTPQPVATKLGLTGLLALLFVASAGEAVRISAGGTARRA